MLYLKKELKIYDNDVYVMAKSKNFLIINDNYIGLKVYDHNLNFVRNIKFSRELIIEYLFASFINDMIVVIDNENGVFYTVDLKLSTKCIQEHRNNCIFSDSFEFDYDNFKLKDSRYEYIYSYKDGKLLKKLKIMIKNIVMLSM